jgi:hypothetical protein
VPPYLFLALAAVFLFIFLVMVVVGLMAVAAYFWEKRTSTNRRYDLIERGLDKDPTAGLKEIIEAIKEIDGDLPGGRPANGHVNGFPSSEPPSKSLSSATEPDG